MNTDFKTIPIKVIRQRVVFGELLPPQESTMPLGHKIDDYVEIFGSLPLSIRIALQNLMTQGKIQIDFDDGSNERLEFQDLSQVMSESEVATAMEAYAAVSTKKTAVGKEITERVVVQPVLPPRKPTFKR